MVLTFTRGPGRSSEQIDLCAVLADRRRLVAGGRLVVTPPPHLRQVVLKALSEIRTVVGLPRLRRKHAASTRSLGSSGCPSIVTFRIRASGPAVMLKTRIVRGDRPRPPAARRERSPSCSRGLDRALRGSRRHQARGRLAASRQNRPDMPLAKRPFRHAELASKLHSRHGVRGLEQISKDDAGARGSASS